METVVDHAVVNPDSKSGSATFRYAMIRAMMCFYCGRINPGTSEICQACGSSLKAAPPVTAEQPATTVASTPVVESASTVQPPAAIMKAPEPSSAAIPAAAQTPLQAGVVPGSVTYAGFWRRFAAYLIDGIVLAIPYYVYSYLVLIPKINSIVGPSETLTPFGSDGLPTPELIALAQAELLLFGFAILVLWLYFSIMESSKLQASLGKLAMGIKVTDTEGRRISFARATGRSFGKLLSGILLVGYIMAAFSAKKQAMHDLIAATFVVIKEK